MLRRVMGVGAAVVALAAAGCGGHDEYPQAVEDSFMTSCLAQPGSTATRCRCVFDGLENELSYDDFKKAEVAIVTRQQAPDKIGERLVEVISDCLE